MPSDHHHWSYLDDSPGGPREWAKYYPTGQHQSPINILVEPCELDTQGPYQLDHRHHLSGQLQRNLKISAGNSSNLVRQQRSHLDSIGNDEDADHQRSPSTSSADSSGQEGGDFETPPPPKELTTTKSNNSHAQSIGYSAKRSSIALQQQQQQRPCGLHSGLKQNTRYCSTNRKIFLGYPRYLNSLQLCNTGHAWQVNLPAELASHTLLSGPSLGDREYRLAQLHCHWGEDCQHGSEHLINGRAFSAEIHFVHWNCTDFGSIEEASRHKHGLAVLGVLVQALEGERNRNKHLDKIAAALPRVRAAHSSTQLTEARLDLKKLFPANRWSYATYEGSLTTPPLSEVVDWLVFLEPIQCSSSQLAEFRQIQCPEGQLTKNCRPIQPANNRLVTLWSRAHNHV